MIRTLIIVLMVGLPAAAGCSGRSEPPAAQRPADGAKDESAMTDENMIEITLNLPDHSLEKITLSEAQWRKLLTAEQYRIARERGTERAFTGAYWDEKTPGVYRCVACELPLFHSETKYKSGTGWPSFYQPIHTEHVEEVVDRGHGMVRTEVVCARCESHLGHVFDDGPAPTGQRYCLNSGALKLDPHEGE